MERRNTIQKQLVLEAVAQLHNHPTAEQVYAQVVKEHPTISKATVYRNLASLSEDGRLRHLPMPAGADRFDHRLDEHAHIECMACGRLDDVEFSAGAPGSALASLDAFAEQATGYNTGPARGAVHRRVPGRAPRSALCTKRNFYAEMRKIRHRGLPAGALPCGAPRRRGSLS